ncbi:DnaJ C-terminal domain-containing protein, partial [Microcoleus sp. B5-C4]|uniref:DnaJ C-terminal domain-containing protein n=1 Tax=Microcoleus sp. B5-C4 TaxID=2818675 RepID=UPI002FD537B1
RAGYLCILFVLSSTIYTKLDELTLVLGAEISVPTPDGSVTMKVPKGVRSGQSLRLRGKGWTLQKGGRGDLLAKLLIVTPKDLSAIEQECYEKIQANTSFNPRTQLEEIKL